MKFKAAKTAKAPVNPRNGTCVALREQFEALRSLPLRDFKKSVMVAERSQRPYLSRFAKAAGVMYFTLPLKGGKILVVRYKV